MLDGGRAIAPSRRRVTQDDLARVGARLGQLGTVLSEHEREVLDAMLELAGRWQVALVNVPFASHRRPSIQLGLLKAIAVQRGFSAQTLHVNLDFAARIGADLYEALCDFGRCFVGDWLFSRAAFGDDTPPRSDRFLEHFRGPVTQLLEETGASEEDLRRIRDIEVPAFLDELVESIRWEDFHAVGLTSTFQQNVAALALARCLKQHWPDVVTIFGGANFEGEMGIEWTRANDVIDYAVIGEGDATLPELLTALRDGGDPAEVRGVAARRDGAVLAPRPRPLNRDLDALPSPDYTEYFERAERLGLIAPAQRENTTIPFESARGCWWGAKSHCTFCGLNGAGMPFRSKSAERVKAELREATKRYRSWRFEAVDNILDMGLLRELLPDLIEEETGYELFYEVKANLTRHQLKLLADAGVRRIQPGIESLSTPVLRLMRKGISAIQNVNTMRWASYYGIDVQWNLLYGFPGETVDDYRQQGALISHLGHLQPPAAVGRIWMERFSPIYTDRDAFPVGHLRPHSSYSYIHPDGLDLDRVAYFFDYEFVDGIPDEELDVTKRLVDAWQAAWDGPAIPQLTFRAVDGFVQVHDRRDPAQPTTTTLGGCLATVFTTLCDRPTTVRALTRELELASSRTRIEVVLTQLCEQGLVMQDGDFFLVLALPANTGR